MASHLPPPPPPPPGREPEPSRPLPPPPAPAYPQVDAPPSGDASSPSPFTVWTVPPAPPSERRVGGWLGFLAGLAVTIALVAGVVVAWPDDDPATAVTTGATPTTLMTKEAAASLPVVPGAPEVPQISTTTTVAADLFGDGPAAAIAEVRARSGNPGQLLEITVYDTYLFVAYVDPAQPDHIDRRMWRGGNVDEAEANPIDDRVDGDTSPKLFGDDEIDLARLPQLVADAPSHYDVPVQVTHVIIDRFLPFDQRVLVRVYASPTDGRSGGGYVTYTASGAFVKVCC